MHISTCTLWRPHCSSPEGARTYRTIPNLQESGEIWIAQPQPGTEKDIVKNVPLFRRFLFDSRPFPTIQNFVTLAQADYILSPAFSLLLPHESALSVALLHFPAHGARAH